MLEEFLVGLHSCPLLFLIHVNDMPQVVQSTLRLYADDASMYEHK